MIANKCPDSRRPIVLIYGMSSQEYRLFKRSKKILVGLRIFDRFQIVLGIGPDQQLGIPPFPNAYRYPEFVLVQLRGAYGAEERIGFIDYESEIL